MKLFFLTLPLIIIVAAALFFLSKRQTDNVHYHAGFAVFVNGKRQDYSAPRYMSIEPCSTGKADKHARGDAHLHDNAGDVVHVHHTAAPWATLFSTIGVTFPGGPVAGYVNGKEVPDIMHRLIGPYDSAVIEVGKKFTPKPSDYVGKDRIRAVEKTSESCGS